MILPRVPFAILVAFAMALAVAEVWALQQPAIVTNPNFGLVVTLDLAVVLPAVCFLLLRRRRPLAPSVLVSGIIFGGFVSALLLRLSGHTRSHAFVVLIGLELLSLAFFGTKIVTLVRRVRADLRTGEPLEQTLRRSLETTYAGLPALLVFRLALTETLLICCGVFGSFLRTPPARPHTFSYHRSQDTTVSLALIIVLEAVTPARSRPLVERRRRLAADRGEPLHAALATRRPSGVAPQTDNVDPDASASLHRVALAS